MKKANKATLFWRVSHRAMQRGSFHFPWHWNEFFRNFGKFNVMANTLTRKLFVQIVLQPEMYYSTQWLSKSVESQENGDKFILYEVEKLCAFRELFSVESFFFHDFRHISAAKRMYAYLVDCVKVDFLVQCFSIYHLCERYTRARLNAREDERKWEETKCIP